MPDKRLAPVLYQSHYSLLSNLLHLVVLLILVILVESLLPGKETEAIFTFCSTSGTRGVTYRTKIMPKLLVTGFGPFSACSVNSSWLLAQAVRDRLAKTRPGLSVSALEIPVEYAAVADKVPALWSTEQPDLVLHLGYYGTGQALRIERRARNAPYCRRDYSECTCEQVIGQAVCHSDVGADVVYRCGFDLDGAADAVRRDFPGGEVELVMSDDAGLYLCEFIYCASLRRDAHRCVFVHVPDCVGDDAKLQLLCAGLCSLVNDLLRQRGL